MLVGCIICIYSMCVCEHEGSGETAGERERERERVLRSAQDEVRADFVTDS